MQTDLRAHMIRLAHAYPHLRSKLLPILKMGEEFLTQDALKEYLQEHPHADKSKHTVKETADKPGAKEEGGKAPKGPKDEGKSDKGIKVKVDEEIIKKRKPKIDSEDLSKYEPDADAEDLAPEHKEELKEYNFDIVGNDARQAIEIARKIKKGIQKGSDACKVSPPVCEGNMGLTRDKMPQIEGEKNVKAMLAGMPDDDEFKELSSKVREGQKKAEKADEKFDIKDVIPDGKKRDGWLDRSKGEAMVEAGADPEDDRPVLRQMLDHFKENGVKSQKTKIAVGMLKATQREIQADKVYGMADSHLKGKAPNGKPFSLVKGHNPIIVSRDGHILDGHHRYAALLTINPEAEMEVEAIDMDMKDLLLEAQATGGVFTADFAGVPLETEHQKSYKSKSKSSFKGKGKKASLVSYDELLRSLNAISGRERRTVLEQAFVDDAGCVMVSFLDPVAPLHGGEVADAYVVRVKDEIARVLPNTAAACTITVDIGMDGGVSITLEFAERPMNASLRARVIQLAHLHPKFQDILVPLLTASDGVSPRADQLKADLEKIPGVDHVYIADQWKGGYFTFSIMLKVRGKLDISVRRDSPFQPVYDIPDYPRTSTLIHNIVKRSRVSVEGVQGPKKLYEYQDRSWGGSLEKRLGGYDGKEIRLEFYAE